MEIYDTIIDLTNSNGGGGGGTVSTAILSYPTGGEVLSDSTLYNYIKTMYDVGTEVSIPYTVVGNPTISNAGIISNFSTSDYLILMSSFSPNLASWEMQFKLKTGNDVTTEQSFIGSTDSNWDPVTAGVGNSVFRFAPSQEGSFVGTQVWFGTYTVLPNTTYWVKLKYDKEYYELSYSLNGKDYVVDIRQQDSNFVKSGINLVLGVQSATNDITVVEPWLGSIDINSIRIYIDSTLIYNGFNFPYKQIATGSKVVDVAYLAQIQALAETNGSALYYVIDTTNETIRLPMGDIYGFLTQAMSV